jgi:hypothetical protein
MSLISDAVLPRMARPAETRTPVAGETENRAADSIRERPATGACTISRSSARWD